MKSENYKNITLQQMEALIQLVLERSFSRAAKKMLLTQPALTKHIQNLESALDVKIVNRSKAGTSLTPEGKVFYDYSERILRLREELRSKIADARGSDTGIISVCASTIPAAYILPRVLSCFRKDYPGIRLRVRSNDSDRTIEAIINGEAEIGFVGKSPGDRKLHAEALWADRLVLAVPADHHWTRKAAVSMKEVAQEPFVVRERGSATRHILESALKEARGLSLGNFNIVAELGSSEAVKEAILVGLGVSIISIHALERELNLGLLKEIPLRNFRNKRFFYLIYRRQFDLMLHHRLFLDYVRNCPIGAPEASEITDKFRKE
jgi:DNA-binding transcriptional LysR family regulator